MCLIRLPLEGTTNTRDIGGYVCADHRYFVWKKVLRSDCMSRLTEKDRDYLVEKYAVKKVIDLRSNQERIAAPNALEQDERVKYIHISLADDMDPNKPVNIPDLTESFLRDFYIDLLENKKDHLKDVLQEIRSAVEEGSVIFHCTAGKDRTGVVAMLLLGICGVSKQDIATNYMQTATNLKYNRYFSEGAKKMSEQYLAKLGKDLMQIMISSDDEHIEYAYDYFINKYGSFHNYFLHVGFMEDEIKDLVEGLTRPLE